MNNELNSKKLILLMISLLLGQFLTNNSLAESANQSQTLQRKLYFPMVFQSGRPNSQPAPAAGQPIPTSTPAPVATATSEPQATNTPQPQPTNTPEPQAGAPIPPVASDAFYVSRNGSNGDGRSWASAWNELNQINWSALNPGSVVYIDGGSSSMTYRSTLDPRRSGQQNNPITIQLSAEPGRNGRAIFFGGNSVPLPECGQRSWNESELNSAGESGIRFENGIQHVVVDGRKRGGIVIHGWSENGVYFNPDRSRNGRDDNPRYITLRYMEIYNNGGFVRRDDGSSRNLYLPDHSDPGIELAGVGHRFEFLEVHDNAADAIQSAYTNPSGGTINNMDDLTITDSWFYNQRAHSGNDNSPSGEACNASNRGGCDELGAPNMGKDYHDYPSSPSNRRESFNWCTHSDGIQIYSSNDFNKMTIERTIIGPNFMTGLILGDRNGGNQTAWVNDLTLNDVVITRYMHNALGMKNPPNNAGERWTLNHVTMYGHYNNRQKGTLNIDSNASYNEHEISNTIMMYGRTNFPNERINFSNNCEYAMYSNTIRGTNADPQFANLLNRDVFENDLNIDFATVFLDDYTPRNSACQNRGSRTTSVADLLSRFNTD